MPDRFGVPVVTTLVCFFSSHAGPWVQAEAPGIPCALFQSRVLLQTTRTRQRRENVASCPGRSAMRRSAAWCAAEPGPNILRCRWVPALRRTAEEALRRVRDTRQEKREAISSRPAEYSVLAKAAPTGQEIQREAKRTTPETAV